MPFRICKTFEIESGHLLSKHPGKCRFPHGHSRRVEVVLVAEQLDANDMVCDFKALKETLHGFLETWDHALCINDADPQYTFFQQTYGANVVAFAQTDPTSEVMARVIFAETKARLAAAKDTRSGNSAGTAYPISAGVRVERVRVTETSSSWAEYYE
jgi:6-pyruvoyltetrahydropterin/6-carboxytetrahydropterin synthase